MVWKYIYRHFTAVSVAYTVFSLTPAGCSPKSSREHPWETILHVGSLALAKRRQPHTKVRIPQLSRLWGRKWEVLRTAVGRKEITWGFKTPPNSFPHTKLGLVQGNSCAVKRVSACYCGAFNWRRQNISPDEGPAIIRRLFNGQQPWPGMVGIQLLGISLTTVHNGLIKIV